jgi:hypothetical protein
MNLPEIAKKVKDEKENIILIYAFNSVGKTQLSVEYKNLTKDTKTKAHAGVYYNAYSEDLFNWHNDEDHEGENKELKIIYSSLNQFHANFNEGLVSEKLLRYSPSYDFFFNSFKDDPSKGIESISFYKKGDNKKRIKISRGEERIFVWCFFLALFEVDGWADKQNQHFFIDDPVSSLDDHNIFITAQTISELIEKHFDKRKIIITTHHLGLFTIISDWLRKGENIEKFRKDDKEKTPKYKLWILDLKDDLVKLNSSKKGVMLYHLKLLQILEEASKDNISFYHFALLRQTLEVIGSFLGKPYFGYVLQQIGVLKPDEAVKIINAHSHKKIYSYQSDLLPKAELDIFNEVFKGLKDTYKFELHIT